MYKCTIANDVKENAKSSSQFHLISCIYIIFVNMEKRESRFFLVITVLRKWVIDKIRRLSSGGSRISQTGEEGAPVAKVRRHPII